MQPVKHTMKIHYPRCQCRHSRNNTKYGQVLVSPCRKEDYNKKTYLFESIIELNKYIHLFPDNCVCTYSNGKYNGGVILISENNRVNYCNNESHELEKIMFKRFSEIKNLRDNSNLINKFCSYFPDLSNYYTLIGTTKKYEESDSINYTFPKGKLTFKDRNTLSCCLREFREETGKILHESEINSKIQNKRREKLMLQHIPMEIIINNFCMKIYII